MGLQKFLSTAEVAFFKSSDICLIQGVPAHYILQVEEFTITTMESNPICPFTSLLQNEVTLREQK